MSASILLVDNPKRTQNNCGSFTLPYEESKKLNYDQKYLVLVIPLDGAQYKYDRLKATISGLNIQITDKEVIK